MRVYVYLCIDHLWKDTGEELETVLSLQNWEAKGQRLEKTYFSTHILFAHFGCCIMCMCYLCKR